jgi:hypothetical protein
MIRQAKAAAEFVRASGIPPLIYAPYPREPSQQAGFAEWVRVQFGGPFARDATGWFRCPHVAPSSGTFLCLEITGAQVVSRVPYPGR